MGTMLVISAGWMVLCLNLNGVVRYVWFIGWFRVSHGPGQTLVGITYSLFCYQNWQSQRFYFFHMKLIFLSCQLSRCFTTIQATTDMHCLTKFLLCVFLCIILNGSSNSAIHLITSFYSVFQVNFPHLKYCPFQDFKCV